MGNRRSKLAIEADRLRSPQAPSDTEVADIAKGKELGAMLEAGEIDALISADVPTCMLAHSLKVGRLFSDDRQVETDYYRWTGIFPVMHTVVLLA